jgi:hypothetical protein
MTIPFLALNFYDTIFYLFYFFITIGLLVYKVEKYPMPQYAIDSEAIMIVLFTFIQYIRYLIGQGAVREVHPKKVVFYMVINLFIILMYAFQLRLQTYVLLADFIINWIGIAFTLLEVFSAVWLLKVFQRKKNRT